MSTQADLRTAAPVNYGHFTTMRVEAGRVRGLARHLERLDRDSWVLFGRGLPEDRVRAALRAAVREQEGPVAARVDVFAPGFDQRAPEAEVELEVAVAVRPVPTADGPLRVRIAGYQRDLPQVKHVGTFGVFYQRRLARMAGYDDVLFATRDGEVSEGSTWNVCFLDEDGTVVWPSAPALPGVSAALVQSGLARLGKRHEVRPVAVADLEGFRAAFASNSLAPVRPVTAIDEVTYPVDEAAAELLRRCHDLLPEERV